ncbi:hypothetical protein ILUMI_09867 [Ignelater luminosus]|uniref:Uncharacterized protein n=1 Tax=Ignelater luminosus TaxID=2038154 RepID=A0A8K0CZ60_IGNLU|nr:hypothetical protein ILUMI_09867 [Ignelater luminosus]
MLKAIVVAAIVSLLQCGSVNSHKKSTIHGPIAEFYSLPDYEGDAAAIFLPSPESCSPVDIPFAVNSVELDSSVHCILLFGDTECKDLLFKLTHSTPYLYPPEDHIKGLRLC